MSELRWILIGCGAILLLGVYLWGRRGRGQAARSDEIESPLVRDPGPAATPGDSAMQVVRQDSSGEIEPPVASRWPEDEWSSTLTGLPEMRLDAPQDFSDPLEPRFEGEDLILPADDSFVDTSERVEHVLGNGLPARPEGARNPQPGMFPRTDAPASGRAAGSRRKIIALRLSAPLSDRYEGSQLRATLESAGLVHGKYGIFHRGDGGDTSIFSVASMVEPGAFDLATMGETKFAGVTLFALLPGPVQAAVAYDQLIECAQFMEQTLGGTLHDDQGSPLTLHRVSVLRDEVLNFEHLLGLAAIQPAS